MDNKANMNATEETNQNGIKTKLTFDDQVVKKLQVLLCQKSLVFWD
ncbi:hypothetical protein GQR36_12685 [Enterococcus termitis]